MTYRIKFAKYGVVRYIGHLDVMRYFQKAIRRSGLPVVYSQGFSPHQLMSFALPLGVGVTSDGEYMEVEFDFEQLRKMAGEAGKTQEYSEAATDSKADDKASRRMNPLEMFILDRLSDYVTEGFEILAVLQLPEPQPNVHRDKAMALVSAAGYLIRVRNGYETKAGFESQAGFYRAFSEFLSQPVITVTKKTKKNEKELNLKEYIYDHREDADPSQAAHARIFENGMQIWLILAAGSAMNIKPELVLESFMGSLGKEYDENIFVIHRCELYMGEPGGFLPLIP